MFDQVGKESTHGQLLRVFNGGYVLGVATGIGLTTAFILILSALHVIVIS